MESSSRVAGGRKGLMAKGRGSAAVAFMALVVAAALLLHSGMTEALTSYTVGGRDGWSFGVSSWPRGKQFLAGDTLVFNYDPSFHNVAAVDGLSYARCSAPPRARALGSGRDQVKLVKGANFFICTVPGHCQSGLKMALVAL